ncbi:hypothetical protein GCM10010169_07020 [Micromonospora fulviviridis]|uniref:hypothetical protein n=1 Tax=Micromonospora fulviviridis TaxID=47860 RepID=UPI0016693917|nr:hypothetical protein [Micromonospora fulviviridis]GGR66143.1 hypothetical protein GCM10010169_07020 [Micromonospora fulviviridis]
MSLHPTADGPDHTIADSLRCEHLRAYEECLLAIPDALAWCWARGGPWRSAVRGLVTEVREV